MFKYFVLVIDAVIYQVNKQTSTLNALFILYSLNHNQQEQKINNDISWTLWLC